MIQKWNDLEFSVQQTIDDVFWETSSDQSFKNLMLKNNFYNIWLGYYLKYTSENVFTWINENKIVAYILGVSDGRTLRQLDNNWIIMSEEIFAKDLAYIKSPAHFHINSLSKFQGQGIGSKLLYHFEDNLINDGISGVHLVTLKGEQNNQFYQSKGFLERNTLFMGNKELILFSKEF